MQHEISQRNIETFASQMTFASHLVNTKKCSEIEPWMGQANFKCSLTYLLRFYRKSKVR